MVQGILLTFLGFAMIMMLVWALQPSAKLVEARKQPEYQAWADCYDTYHSTDFCTYKLLKDQTK